MKETAGCLLLPFRKTWEFCFIWGWGTSFYLVTAFSRILHLIFFFVFFLGLHPWHMEVPRLGVESELQLLAYHSNARSQRLTLQLMATLDP